MPYLFDHLDTIRHFLALSPVGLFTDVDGTISEIAPAPDEARVSPGCRESLAALARHLALVVAVSGRPAAQARALVGVDEMLYIGNHGYDRWVDGGVELVPGAEGYPARITAALDDLRRLLPIEGIILENKGPTATIHYRRCPEPAAAVQAILSALKRVNEEGDLQVRLGKMSVEFRPPLDVSKWTGVRSLIHERDLNAVLYLGDDLTDVDVFVGLRDEGLRSGSISVAVVGSETPPEVVAEADFTLDGVADVERFLKRVAAEVAGRQASGGPGTGYRATS
jgi:trehalose 6-phosphate phosphatase